MLKILSERREAARQNPSRSKDEENRRQVVAEFPGIFSRSWSGPSENFRKNNKKSVNLGRSRARKKRRRTSGRMVEETVTRVDTPEKIVRYEQTDGTWDYPPLGGMR